MVLAPSSVLQVKGSQTQLINGSMHGPLQEWTIDVGSRWDEYVAPTNMTFQEVTHPNTTLTLARLTTEFSSTYFHQKS